MGKLNFLNLVPPDYHQESLTYFQKTFLFCQVGSSRRLSLSFGNMLILAALGIIGILIEINIIVTITNILLVRVH